ncbi:hypothetical protein HPB48_021690 [Haemaphysalis longicornis]|uniref:Endonuclease/exonuclease/phosphatase domain-containing protein n=1 Tax=Haemaphysalis longicornis TaxID=44386 RepID=A0A9J6G8G6_HAELO|nr:hypothetical protein HPB48_021690 [Haemaphysalis longicornis]
MIIDDCPVPHIIVGDFNAHHEIWGSIVNTTRGRRLANFIQTHDLDILNDGSPTFFQGATYSSCLDLALISRRLVQSRVVR